MIVKSMNRIKDPDNKKENYIEGFASTVRINAFLFSGLNIWLGMYVLKQNLTKP